MKQEKMARDAAKHDWFTVAPGVWGLKDLFVNVYMIHNAKTKSWVLVDAGLKTSAAKIRHAVEELFWPDSRPAAIVLTHAHFDHVGSLKMLAEEWDVPIYAHEMEKPYLTGECAYPPPDPLAGGGMMAYSSFLYPRGPIDIGERYQELPEDGSVPGLPGWTWIHTPGHSPGHVSLFRKRDKVLLAGDAFVTTRQESLTAVIRQSKVLSGPPKYFTCDWDAAADSVRRLAALDPGIAATGHGRPMEGEELRQALRELADNFDAMAVPRFGRYTHDPAVTDEQGVRYVPPYDPRLGRGLAIAGFVAAAAVLYWWSRQPRQRSGIAALGAGAQGLARQAADRVQAAESKKPEARLRPVAKAVGDLARKGEKVAAQAGHRLVKAAEHATDRAQSAAASVKAAAPRQVSRAATFVDRLSDNGQTIWEAALTLLDKRLSRAAR